MGRRRQAWLLLAAALVLRLPAVEAAPPALTTLGQVHSLSNAQANQALPVAFTATVTLYDRPLFGLWVQDAGQAVYVETGTPKNLVPGDRVLVHGVTQGSFRPIVVSNDVKLLGHGAPPPPIAATFDQLMRGDLDCLRVTVQARVQTADSGLNANARVEDLQLLMDGGYVEALVVGGGQDAMTGLLDSDVEVTGVVATRFDAKKQLIGAALYVGSPDDIRVVRRTAAGARSLPLTPMDQLLSGYHVRDLTRRVRVEGTITYYQPGSSLVLQHGDQSLLVMTQTNEPLRVGDVADASGFPDASTGSTVLTHAEVQDTSRRAPVAPRAASLADLRYGSDAFDLVSTEGRLLMAVRQARFDEYVLVADGDRFSAIYRHPENVAASQLPRFRSIAIGSRVRVTGICTLYGSDPFNGPKDFDLLLQSPDDLAVVAGPPILSIRNLIAAVGLLLAVVIVACLWGWSLSRKVTRQSQAIAARIEAEATVERQRSRILEDINGTRPLSDILVAITEMVSSSLGGAPSWCEFAGGIHLGHRETKHPGLENVSHEIPARSGPPHGKLSVAVALSDPAGSNPQDALAMGAWLAAMAIETRGLYSDLLHRSEFDLLTNIYNRFAFEKRLQALIDDAQRRNRPFGLLYVDLDGFKRVNDEHGHQVGDLYLQEAARRMKHQLRPGDVLARLGGDEFAALISTIGSRADLDYIAQRLERCFDEPFAVRGYTLRGAASVGVAVFPEHGATIESLLDAADSAMYMAKSLKASPDSGVPNS
ncbi:MAG TPA: GGDEF domain-containing protein [Acidobacteriaceae bacterium]|nr:GGDEF domain-containing protein [Acidobacteriaceae bacterium]